MVLSHKRNSKGFDQRNRRGATSSRDEILPTNTSWTDNRSGTEHKRFGADDDQRRGRNVPVSDLFEVV